LVAAENGGICGKREIEERNMNGCSRVAIIASTNTDHLRQHRTKSKQLNPLITNENQNPKENYFKGENIIMYVPPDRGVFLDRERKEIISQLIWL
jgi:hypothetical protein